MGGVSLADLHKSKIAKRSRVCVGISNFRMAVSSRWSCPSGLIVDKLSELPQFVV